MTTFSIGIDTPEITKQKTREAADYPVLKVKVGLATDEPTIEAVRSVTKKPLRVDANEGWKDKEEAVRKINWLEKQGVEFIEQPMPAEMLEETRWVRTACTSRSSPTKRASTPSDIPKLREAYRRRQREAGQERRHAGGVPHDPDRQGAGHEDDARLHDLSSVTVTAAAHLSPLVDYADLDGNLLIANDPFHGVRVEKGKLILPNGPGLGLTPA